MSAVCSNQNAESCVRTLPLSGIGEPSTKSNAEMRSVVTISRYSPPAYMSLTFPRPYDVMLGRAVLSTACVDGRDEAMAPVQSTFDERSISLTTIAGGSKTENVGL